MAKLNKEYKWRMEGMLYAHKIVTEKGLDALVDEIKMRGIMKLDIWMTQEDATWAHKTLAKELYQSIITTVLYALNDSFGFGKKRLHNFKRKFDKLTTNVEDLNWHGEHYVRFRDYAKELNEKYDMGLDLARIDAAEDIKNKKNEAYHRLDLEGTCNFLKNEGFEEAAICLEEKVANLRKLGDLND